MLTLLLLCGSTCNSIVQQSGLKELRDPICIRILDRAATESSCTFQPAIDPLSERLVEDSRALPSNFLARQEYFRDLKQARLQHLQCEVASSLVAHRLLLTSGLTHKSDMSADCM